MLQILFEKKSKKNKTNMNILFVERLKNFLKVLLFTFNIDQKIIEIIIKAKLR